MLLFDYLHVIAAGAPPALLSWHRSSLEVGTVVQGDLLIERLTRIDGRVGKSMMLLAGDYCRFRFA